MDFRTDFEQFNAKYPVTSRQVNGLTFHYRLGGNGEKAVVLLIGGLGISDAFYKHFTEFASRFTVLTFDYPYETCRNAVLADGIAALIQELGLKNVYLVGQSYGGLIAQVIAKRHPEIVSGLVLSNTGCLDADMGDEAKAFLLQMVDGLKKTVRLVKAVPMPLLKRILFRRIVREFAQCEPDERKYLTDLFAHVFKKITRRHELNMCRLMIDLENELECTKPAFTYLDKSVLLLLSEDDHTFGEPVKQALINTMPNPVVNTGIGGGHLSLLLNADEYIRTVAEFINGVAGKACCSNCSG